MKTLCSRRVYRGRGVYTSVSRPRFKKKKLKIMKNNPHLGAVYIPANKSRYEIAHKSLLEEKTPHHRTRALHSHR